MRNRQSGTLPPGVSAVIVPKVSAPTRLVSVACAVQAGIANEMIALVLYGGAGERIASWSTPQIADNTASQIMTFSTAPTDSGQLLITPTGDILVHVSIPDDLWILPQQTLRIEVIPGDNADAIAEVVYVMESYEPSKKSMSKKVAASYPQPQDAPP